jgi:hypothetical protein
MSRSSKVAAPNIDVQIERWPIERLMPRANNPRKHSRAQVGVARMIRNVGIEGLLSAAPFIGDVFDVVFKANRLTTSS